MCQLTCHLNQLHSCFTCDMGINIARTYRKGVKRVLIGFNFLFDIGTDKAHEKMITFQVAYLHFMSLKFRV